MITVNNLYTFENFYKLMINNISQYYPKLYEAIKLTCNQYELKSIMTHAYEFYKKERDLNKAAKYLIRTIIDYLYVKYYLGDFNNLVIEKGQLRIL